MKDNILYYSANYEDHIFNIYALNLKNHQLSKLTNHIYGAFYPIILNESLYFLYYDSKGYHLSSMKINQTPLKILNIKRNELSINYKLEKAGSLEKYTEPLKYNFILPYAENNEIGGIFLSLSEGLNYGIGVGALTDFNNISPVFGFYLDYYTQNFGIFKYQNNTIHSDLNISKNVEFHLKRKNYLTFNGEIRLENFEIKAKRIGISIITSPYKINNQNYYEGNSILGYSNNIYYFQYSKAFDIFSMKSEPYIYYDTSGNLIPGVKISKKYGIHIFR
ncbi:hypothetical protein [Marinitoga lauensis]|uniref:hypothetical protein n=1 Tax=Marinitoga lauensis TaxID=2201189 RepID=UPI00197EB4DB|nr:hypothetical protein [Marinitoga lauensis]